MQQTSPLQNQPYLVIQHGNRWADILRLQSNTTVWVGRSSDNQVVVKDERVSRQHAKLTFEDGQWLIRDLTSRNGTQVDGHSIQSPHPLQCGQTITVGPCQMTFTFNLSQTVQSNLGTDSKHPITSQASAAIVGRLSNSQWSTELSPSEVDDLRHSPSHWSFFYRLVFDLVQCKTEDHAAAVALDRLLSKLQLDTGAILRIDDSSMQAQPAAALTPAKQKQTKRSERPNCNDNQPEVAQQIAVLAARQGPGCTYHRLSDFLLATVVSDKQAIIARNIVDDSQLSVARQSGQHEISSSLCAPLRDRSSQGEPVIGLLHLYTSPDGRQLTAEDLDIAVGVADNLVLAICRLREKERLNNDLSASRRQIDQLEHQLEQSSELIGNSPPMLRIKQSIQRAGPTSSTILVRGESGSGKELVARAIHLSSKRKSGPLVCLNCAALAPTLLESELFGHEKGAFTGATERKIGKFEAANKGTLFLDEVGEMPLELQAKFLRVLEGHPFERLGGNSSIHTDVRVIAATNRDLEQAIHEKLFREDLYYRLRVVEIQLPALRHRPDDIPMLVEHFLSLLRDNADRRIVGIDPQAMEALVRHLWPGNVRELKNVIERSVVLGTGSTITLDELNLPNNLGQPNRGSADTLGSEQPFIPWTLEEVERVHMHKMLQHVDGNKSKAAQLLGIERSTLDRKLKRIQKEEP